MKTWSKRRLRCGPAAEGDAAMIAFLRHGRPKGQGLCAGVALQPLRARVVGADLQLGPTWLVERGEEHMDTVTIESLARPNRPRTSRTLNSVPSQESACRGRRLRGKSPLSANWLRIPTRPSLKPESLAVRKGRHRCSQTR
jgi:hypothetical protein